MTRASSVYLKTIAPPRMTEAAECVADIGHVLPPPRVCGKFNEDNARGRRGGEEGVERERSDAEEKTTVTDGGVERPRFLHPCLALRFCFFL